MTFLFLMAFSSKIKESKRMAASHDFDFTNFTTKEKGKFVCDVLSRQLSLGETCPRLVKKILEQIISPFITEEVAERFGKQIIPLVLNSINFNKVVEGFVW